MLQDEDGCTALMHAARYGHFNAVKMLRMLGADLEARNHRQQTAHDIALQEGHAEVAILLKPSSSRNWTRDSGVCALGHESRSGAR